MQDGDRVMCMFYGGQVEEKHSTKSLGKELCMIQKERLCMVWTLEVTLVLQKLLLAPKKEEESQRNKIFKTRCTVNGKVCDVIIDTDSSGNIVS